MSLRRPTQRARWAFGSSATLVQPPSGSAEAGFTTEQRPPAQWFNWQWNTIGQWIDFLAGPDVENWSRHPWPGNPATEHFDNPSAITFAIDTDTSDSSSTAAAFRYAAVGDRVTASSTESRMWVSQRGNAWEPRDSAMPSGVTGPYALKSLVMGRWLLGCLSSVGAALVYYATVDSGSATGPMGDEGNTWTAATLPGSPTQVKAFAQINVSANVVAACAAEAMYSADNGVNWTACTFASSPSGAGLDVVSSGVKYVWVSSDGEVYSSPDGVTFTDVATLAPGPGTWRLCAGDAGEVLAYRVGSSASVDLYLSGDSGVSWTAVTQTGDAPKRVTSVAYREGTWIATGTRSPWLWISNDLAAWRTLTLPTESVSETAIPPALYSVAWDGRAWVAVGNGVAFQCGRAADPSDGLYVAEDTPSTLADAGSFRGRLLDTDAPTNGQVYAWNSSSERWEPTTVSGGSSPLTTNGDLYTRAAGVDARLAVGTTGQVLAVSGGAPAWTSLPWASHFSAGVQTTDATQTTCGSYTVPSNSAVTAKLLVTALKSDFSASCGWEILVTVRNNGGTLTIEGGGAVIIGPTDSATMWAVTVDVSGTSLRLRVTGAAATTIDWTARWVVG